MLAALCLTACVTVNGAEEELPKRLTLEEAVEYALKNHTSIIAAQSNIEQNKARHKEALDAYGKNRYNTFANNRYATFNDVLIKSGVNYFSANAGLETAKATYNQTEYTVKMGVEAAYIGYINSGKKVEATEAALATAQSRYDNEVLEKELGMSSEYELMVAKNTLTKIKSDHRAAVRAERTALAQLKASTGLPVAAETEFVIKPVEMPQMPEITLEEAIVQAKENNLSIKSAALTVSVQEATVVATGSWYSKNTYAYQNAYSALVYARDSYAAALAQAEMNVHKAYDNMLTVIDNAEIIKSTAELMEKTYEINKQKYELGLIAKLDLEESWYELQSLKIQQSELDSGIYSAIKAFEMSYLY